MMGRRYRVVESLLSFPFFIDKLFVSCVSASDIRRYGLQKGLKMMRILYMIEHLSSKIKWVDQDSLWKSMKKVGDDYALAYMKRYIGILRRSDYVEVDKVEGTVRLTVKGDVKVAEIRTKIKDFIYA